MGWDQGSRGVGFKWSNGLVSGFKTQALLNFVVQQLGVLHQVLVTCDSGVTCFLNYFYAVPDPVAASHALQSTWKATVFHSLCKVFHGFSSISAFALDADGGAEGPTASVTVEAGQTAGFTRMPHINAGSGITGVAMEAQAGENFIHVELNMIKLIWFKLH